jgi:hypothetical protein
MLRLALIAMEDISALGHRRNWLYFEMVFISKLLPNATPKYGHFRCCIAAALSLSK